MEIMRYFIVPNNHFFKKLFHFFLSNKSAFLVASDSFYVQNFSNFYSCVPIKILDKLVGTIYAQSQWITERS